MQDLEGKVAIVTGAGRDRGIGQATALELARRGAAVVATDLARPAPDLAWDGIPTVAEDMAVLDKTVEDIKKEGGQAIAMAVDVRSEAEIKDCVARTVDAFGGVDVLFNNAGTGLGAQPFFELSDEIWDLSWRINVMGMVWLCRAAIPQMQERGGGSIINNSSVSGLRAFPDFAAYTATKHAVIGLTKVLALEFGRDGIRANAVCPGDIDTQMGDLSQALLIEAGLISDVSEPLPTIGVARRGVGADVAQVVAWLAGPASGFVSGTTITIDGAWPEGL